MITEGSDLVLPVQVYSLFKKIIIVFQLAKMEEYLAKKEGGIAGFVQLTCVTWVRVSQTLT